MNRTSIATLGILLAAILCYGQDTTSPAAPGPIGHGAFPVKVAKSLDSSKLKDGDVVEVETAGSFKLPDGTLVPKGSKVTGHVTAAKARSKGDPESQLTLAFDKLSVASGKLLSIKGTVQAVFPPLEEAAPLMAGKASGAAGGGYSAGSAGGGYAGGTMGTVTDAKSGSNTDSENKPVADPVADPKSVGVKGIRDLQLDNGVLTSKGKNVKLGSGVRMIVHVDILG